MSHSGTGRHGVWAQQNINTFSRCTQAHGHQRAWDVFVGVDFSQLPPVPDVILQERTAALKALWDAKKANDRRFNRLDCQLSRRIRAGELTWPQYYEAFDALWAETQAISKRADDAYAARIIELDTKAAEQQQAVAHG